MCDFSGRRADEIEVGDVVRIVTDPSERNSLWVVLGIDRSVFDRSDDSVAIGYIDEFGARRGGRWCAMSYLRSALALVSKKGE